MAYLNAYLDPCAAYGWQGGPAFKTRIVEMANGRERRNADIDQARHQFDAPFQNIGREAYRAIKQMHLVCRGQLHAFKYRDELDYQADNAIFGTGDSATTEFQLGKTSTVDGISYKRHIYIVNPGAVVRVNGTITGASIDPDRGLVIFGGPPAMGAVLRITCTFALWVRFNQDYLPFSIDNPDFMNGSVSLIEVPPPPEATS